MKKPDCWLYEEFDTNGELRSSQIWTFLPSAQKRSTICRLPKRKRLRQVWKAGRCFLLPKRKTSF